MDSDNIPPSQSVPILSESIKSMFERNGIPYSIAMAACVDVIMEYIVSLELGDEHFDLVIEQFRIMYCIKKEKLRWI